MKAIPAPAMFVLGFSGLDAWYYRVNAIAVIVVVSLSEPSQDVRADAAAA